MSKRALLGKALAVVALSASLAGITAGTASAKPKCELIAAAWVDAIDLSYAAYVQGDNVGGSNGCRSP